MDPATSMSKHNRGSKQNTASAAQSKPSLKSAVVVFCAQLKDDDDEKSMGKQVGKGAGDSPTQEAQETEEQIKLRMLTIPERAHSVLDSSKLHSILELGEVPRGAKC